MRIILIVIALGYCARASTVTARVRCLSGNGTTIENSGFDATSAACSTSDDFSYSQAFAAARGSGGSFSAYAEVDTFRGFSSAAASVEAVLALIVFGADGTGYLLPTNFDAWRPSLRGDGFGSFVNRDTGPIVAPAFCATLPPSPFPQGRCSPFTFGQINTYVLQLSASAGGGSHGGGGYVWFRDGFQFWDSSGNILTNVQYTLTELPEPAAGWLMLLGVGAVAAVALRAARQSRGTF